jgi:hypothetical protein
VVPMRLANSTWLGLLIPGLTLGRCGLMAVPVLSGSRKNSLAYRTRRD